MAERQIGPSLSIDQERAIAPVRLTRPKLGRREEQPQRSEGETIEPRVSDPIEKMSTGPIHFSWTGWAYVEILAESTPTPNGNFHLVYDHPQSFESDAWLATGRKTNHCVCHMNAGYSSGWCSASFGRQLVAREILCRARGDEHCRFIMADPTKIDDHVDRYLKENGLLEDGA